MGLENITENTDVTKGRVLHDTRFKREKNRDVAYEGAKIDFLKYGDEMFVHVVKRSKKFEEAHIWQLKSVHFILSVTIHLGNWI